MSGPALVLGIETSCDDTCAAVVTGGRRVLSNKIASQMDHDRFGGVVPEVASRRHLEMLDTVVETALESAETGLDEIDAIAATRGPGLIGTLLVGFSYAKALAAATGKPLIPVDHLQGHVSANFLEPNALEPPFICLVASGGHTFLARVEDRDRYEVLGRTTDDAAGEAFDKGARLLGLGYPGGAALDKLASDGDPTAFDFPRTYIGDYDFSFSGIKTALLYKLRALPQGEFAAVKADLAASYQRAIVDMLVARIERAVEQTGIGRVAIGGGVAANSQFRERVSGLGLPVKVPPRDLCTDNAAMIAAAALDVTKVEYPDYAGFDAYPTGKKRPQLDA
ncbi:MAG TPA: tRNA (adenosine(37)-N6)-threonylcarbamoyltransferase complex transferase subunit TsaD [Solirubrobacterales bacterium]|nr:tRNA (adenosine(37)-N6)-threonylcarbamoyltransferase complex transferase subunit TsaD [Solirubrobacterales bacterium]